jgi:DNA-binding transcriptional ArsR family regulator
MPGRKLRSLVRVVVTPRFEIFYALRALGLTSEYAAAWRNRTTIELSNTLLRAIRRLSPQPVMWALLADSLRDAAPDPDFAQLLDTITSLDDSAFQRAILGGVFHDATLLEAIITGRTTLGDAVSEQGSGNPLLGLVGLYPFNRSRTATSAFTRIVHKPEAYRVELVTVLERFWSSSFATTWDALEPGMQRLAEMMSAALAGGSVAEFARENRLPALFDDTTSKVASVRGTTSFSYAAIREIYFIPSGFNDARFWGAYGDESQGVRLFFPIFDAALLDSRPTAITAVARDPALGFRALGDTTRYAMARLLAQSPRTSVELARAFDVSKATISHHVQLLRSAGLLEETITEKGVLLTLNRRAVEQISVSAANEMFAAGEAPVLRRSRRQNKSHESSPGKQGPSNH